jgi:hypothetical protein
MYYPGSNKPTTREEWEKLTLSSSPEVRRDALKHIYDEGFSKGLLLGLGILFIVLIICNS